MRFPNFFGGALCFTFFFKSPTQFRQKQLFSNMAIEFSGVEKYYNGIKKIGADFSIPKGTHLTVVGENGSGKSTLAKMLINEIIPDIGTVILPPNLKIGYLPQDPSQETNVKNDESLLTYLTNGANEYIDSVSTIVEKQNLTSELSLYEHDPDYKEALKNFHTVGGYELDKMLFGLGIGHLAYNRLLSTLSGGERTRASLVKTLFAEPDILILDEPTNHLDRPTIKWLEAYLKKYDGTLVLITHDRHLLQKITRAIVEIDRGEANFFQGTYFDYLERKRKQAEKLIQDYYCQIKEERSLQEKISTNKVSLTIKPKRRDNNKAGFHARGERKQNSVTKDIRARQLKLDNIEANRIILPAPRLQYHWAFYDNREKLSACHINFSNITFSYNIDDVLLENISGSIAFGSRIVITGRNGSGKSTFIRLLLNEITPTVGSINFSGKPQFGYLPQGQTSLDLKQTPMRFLQDKLSINDQEARKILLTHCLFTGPTIQTEIEKLSIGQQRRLQLAYIILQNPNVLVLDEPTNHLDIMSAEELETQLSAYKGTIIAISHDQYFIEKIATEIWEIKNSQFKITERGFIQDKTQSPTFKL